MFDSQNLSLHNWQQQENVIAEFEAALQQKTSASIETFLPKAGTDRFRLLLELVHIELEHRLKAGEFVRVEDYLKRFPELAEHSESLQELIASEYILRLRMDSQLDVSEYSKRFAKLGQALIVQLQDAAEQDNRNRLAPAVYAETLVPTEEPTQSQIGQESKLAAADPVEQNPPLAQYGRYVVKKLLGAGAFGQVFLAHDPKTKRDVALKVPRRRLQPGSEEDERFLREARAVATLQHQQICPLFDLLETDDRIVLVMPYIQGGSLAEQIKQHDFSLDKSVQLVSSLALAMAYAHEAGVIHRDLKPANILMDEKQSQPVITDFGLALRNDIKETTLTQQGQLLGTPAYMSPEQAGGEIDQIGPASDLYSLGMILYELSTGRLPFSGSITQVIGQILIKEPAAPTSLNPEISSALEQTILKAIAKNPQDRFGSMKEFAAALKQLQPVDKPKTDEQSGSLPKEPQEANKSNKRWIVTGMVMLCVMVGSWAFLKSSSPQTELAVTASKTSVASPDLTSPASFEQLDLLNHVQLPNDIVLGNWTMQSEGLTVDPGGFSRLSIPVQTQADYKLNLEFTRTLSNEEVNLIFPVGSKSCMLSLGQGDWCGLELPYGKKSGQHIPGHLLNNQRHKLSMKVSSDHQHAFISADLNGATILNWQGSLDSLSLRSDWQVQQHSFGLGAHQAQVIFHSLLFSAERGHKITTIRWEKHKTEKYQSQKDLLKEINPTQHAFRGDWKLTENPAGDRKSRGKQALGIDSGSDFSSLILPVIPTGDYQFQVHLTRTQGHGEINLLLPVGDAYCMLSLGLDGEQFGIQYVNGRYWDLRKQGIFLNGKEHVIQVDVALEPENQASIRFQIDGNEIFHWKGDRAELSMRDMWRIYPKTLGLGVDQDAIQFHKLLFQSKSGEVFQIEQK